ncbi:hypothetical protein PUS82_05275 [Cytobacillus firmus]|uniref:hypothetical protein n=1 Tax=Cytobacillus firmus TaxID=1399 RepID=UPI00237C1636|nr:hypothetical protein [Cytobacillus firmus]MDD9310714.1 hypothetical protein [Cytobacillus firmus]
MITNVENMEQHIRRLQNSLIEAHSYNQQHVKATDVVVNVLLQLWKKAFVNNLDIAEPVAYELQVHPDNSHYQANLACPVSLANALQQTLYYTSMKIPYEPEEKHVDDIQVSYNDDNFGEEMLEFVKELVSAEH